MIYTLNILWIILLTMKKYIQFDKKKLFSLKNVLNWHFYIKTNGYIENIYIRENFNYILHILMSNDLVQSDYLELIKLKNLMMFFIGT